MAKFKVSLIYVDEYEIEVDESIWTPEEIKDWARTFYPASRSKDIAKHLAYSVKNQVGASCFMEGFGYVKIYNPDGKMKEQFGGFKKLEDDDERYTKGLSVKVIVENDELESEIDQID